jgi:hypothetical protein
VAGLAVEAAGLVAEVEAAALAVSAVAAAEAAEQAAVGKQVYKFLNSYIQKLNN